MHHNLQCWPWHAIRSTCMTMTNDPAMQAQSTLAMTTQQAMAEKMALTQTTQAVMAEKAALAQTAEAALAEKAALAQSIEAVLAEKAALAQKLAMANVHRPSSPAHRDSSPAPREAMFASNSTGSTEHLQMVPGGASMAPNGMHYSVRSLLRDLGLEVSACPYRCEHMFVLLL